MSWLDIEICLVEGVFLRPLEIDVWICHTFGDELRIKYYFTKRKINKQLKGVSKYKCTEAQAISPGAQYL